MCLGATAPNKNSSVTGRSFYPIGSGVVAYVKGKGNQIVPCLITAKHCFENKKQKWFPESLQLRFNGSDTLSFDEYLGIKLKLIDKGKKLWFAYPDSLVDLACIPLTDANIIVSKDDPISIVPIPYDAFGASSDIYDGAEIFVLGFPGVVGYDVLVKSVLRRGIISWTSPRNPQQNTFLIDCNIFPGNSGGPVFTYPIGIANNGVVRNGGFIRFAGIVSKIYNSVEPVTDSLNNTKLPNVNRTLFYKQRAGLAVVEPASRVKDLLKHVEDFLK